MGRMDVPEMRLQGRQVWARARRTLKASCTLRLTGARGARGGEIDSPAPQSCRADLSSRTRLRLPCVQRTPDNLSSARRQGQRRRIRCLPFCVYGSGCFTDRRGCPLVARALHFRSHFLRYGNASPVEVFRQKRRERTAPPTVVVAVVQAIGAHMVAFGRSGFSNWLAMTC